MNGVLMSFVFEKTSCISLSCKLVPVHYREYEYSLLDSFTNTQVRSIQHEHTAQKFPTLNLEVI